MRSFIRIKVIKGTEYLYKITPYYDSVSKRVRQKSTYLGKNVSGTPVRVRSQLPLRVYSYGELLPFIDQIQHLGIKGVLAKHLQPGEIAAVMAIALNKAVHPLSLPHISAWYEGTHLHVQGSTVDLSSESASNLFQKIGHSALPEDLSRHIVKFLGTRRTLLFNFCSVRSSEERLVSDRYGLSSNLYSLIPMKLSLMVDRDRAIPVAYSVHQGIVDVAALMDMCTSLTDQGVSDSLLALDCDFFSNEIIRQLKGRGFPFTVHACHSAKAVDELMNAIQLMQDDITLNMLHQGESVQINKVQMGAGPQPLKGYCYRFPLRELEEKDRLSLRLSEITRAIESLAPNDENRERIEHIAAGYREFIDVRTERHQTRVSVREDAVSRHIDKIGRFIILHNNEISWEECLSIYRLRKEFIDRSFDICKNEIYVFEAGEAQETFKRGLSFVCFMGLMIRMALTRKLQDCGLSEHYSLADIVRELSTLKLVELTNGKTITTEHSNKQKAILARLGVGTDKEELL